MDAKWEEDPFIGKYGSIYTAVSIFCRETGAKELRNR
jgi:hypothetical protein